MLYYVKINDFEVLDLCIGQGYSRDKKLESGQCAGVRLSKKSSIKRTPFENKTFILLRRPYNWMETSCTMLR